MQRAALDRFAGPTALAALDAYRAARGAAREATRSLAALGGDERARAREIDLLRFQIEEITAAGLTDLHEDVALEAEEDLLADATAHREALARAHASLEGAALDAIGAAQAELDGPRRSPRSRSVCMRPKPRWPTSNGSCGSRPMPSVTTPRASTPCGPAATGCASSAASTATRSVR